MPEERRLVTVLFADVAGSTALADHSDPEDVRAVLGRYYEIARDVVGSHGGTLEKFIGDAVMAVFGIPLAHGDDAARALDAALALRDAVARDDAVGGLGLRIGVNTGEVVANRDRQADFLVTGDAVNVAARLQQTAEAGTVLVGGRTIAAVGGGFRFGPRRATELKGKRESVDAAILEGRAEGAPQRLAPLIGRQADLAQLLLLAERSFGEGRPRLVTITAPAGTGKSRLAREFLARVRVSATDGAFAIAQCLPYGAAITYLPLRGIASGLLGVPFEDVGVAHIAAPLLAAGHTSADAEHVATLVAATLGKGDPGEARERDEFFGAWRVFVETMAARRATVVVLEDLHWASDSLLDLIDQVTQPRTRGRLVILALGRPELVDRRPAWGAGRRNSMAMTLEPLTGEESARLLEHLLPEAPPAARARIADRAEGNPFFAEELARAYVERVQRGAESDLPDSVQSAVLARLDLLPEGDRSLLQLAAAAGRTVRAATLAALLPERAEGDLAAGLDRLADRELLTSGGDGTYTFTHIIIREVAYGTLPRAQRVRAHLRLWDWFEAEAERRGDSMLELAAYHCRQALALSQGAAVTGGVVDTARAVALFERVGLRAKLTGADREAVAYLEDAIRLAPPRELPRLFERLGDAMEITDEASRAFARAFETWRREGESDPSQGARLLRKRLTVNGRWRGSATDRLSWDEYQRLLAEARALAARGADQLEAGRLDLAEAFGVWNVAQEPSRMAASVESAERARDAFAGTGDANALSECFDAISGLRRATGDFERALAADRDRLELLDRLSLLERSDAIAMLCWDLVLMGRFDDAIAGLETGRRALRAGESEGFYAYAFVWAILAARLAGRFDDALANADRLVALFESNERGMRSNITVSSWFSAQYVARARCDETRAARYRAVADELMRLAPLRDDDPISIALHARWTHDPSLVERSLSGADVLPHGKAELLAELIFEGEQRLDPALLDAVERVTRTPIPLLTTRLMLARALSRDASALRDTVRSLDAAGIRSDAARAQALVAQRTNEAADRREAERRLSAIGDRLYLQRLQKTPD